MMITDGTYPAASRVAPRIRAYFEQHGAAERSGVPVPAEATIAHLIDAAFWTSLRREEGYVPRISLAFVPVEAARDGIRFARPLPLLPAALARIAPAVERPGIHLAAWYGPDGGELVVWGTVRHIATFTLVVEVAAPGLLVIKHHRGGERRKFVNVAVLEGDQVKIVDERASTLPDCPPLVTAMLGFDAPELWHTEPGVLVQLAVSMRAHGRGGLLLVVPDDGDEWRESVLQPVLYGIEPRFGELAALMRQPAAPDDASWEDALAHLVAAIGGLTAVDGATIMTRSYELLAFGAKVSGAAAPHRSSR